MTDKEQIIINGINIFKTLNDWADFLSKEWCSDERPIVELVKIYISDINGQLARKTQECEELKNTLEKLTRGVVLPAIPEPDVISLTDSYRKALEEIEEIANEPCVADALDDCKSCVIWCEHKDILNIINKAKGEE